MAKEEDPNNVKELYNWLAVSEKESPKWAPKTKRKWNLEVVEPYGRCTVAAENIAEGDVLFVDAPVITGPKQNCNLICLGCYRMLDDFDYACSKCLWPLCGKECEQRGYHPLECSVFCKNPKKPILGDYDDNHSLYESILPLRCYLLKEKFPQKWSTLTAMESHDDLRRYTELFRRQQHGIVNFIIDTHGLDATREEINRCTGVLDVNCHEVRSFVPGSRDEYRVRGLYPMCAMMSHDCASNTHHTLLDDMTMLVVASRPIKKGEQLTATYTHILSATTERRKHLHYSKFFHCLCDRCKDPTEMRTYFGALRCSQGGCGGSVINTNPKDETNMSHWECDKCNFMVKAETVERLNKMIYFELARIPPQDIKEVEGIIQKYKNTLHPQHFHIVGMKHTLTELYGRVENYTLGELTVQQISRKIECCRDLLTVLDMLDPGISRMRGLTLYELHAPLLILANKLFAEKALTKHKFLRKMEEAAKLLEKCIHSLQFEPMSSFEGEICKIAEGSLKELKGSMKQVDTLGPQFFKEPSPEAEPAEQEKEITLKEILASLEIPDHS